MREAFCSVINARSFYDYSKHRFNDSIKLQDAEPSNFTLFAVQLQLGCTANFELNVRGNDMQKAIAFDDYCI